MDELPLYSTKTFRGAIGDALRFQRGDEMGDYVKKAFAQEVAAQSPWAENTILGYLKGARRPTDAALEAMAVALDLPAGAAYFLEYRVNQCAELCKRYPELERRFYDAIMKTAAELKEQGHNGGVRTKSVRKSLVGRKMGRAVKEKDGDTHE